VTGGDLKEGMDVIVSVQGGAQAGSSSSSSSGAQPPRGPRMF